MPLITFSFLTLGFPTISYHEKKMFFLMFFIHLKKKILPLINTNIL